MDASILTGSLASREHPEAAELQRFLRGEASRAEARVLVRHLLAGCPKCRKATRQLWELGDRPLLGIGERE